MEDEDLDAWAAADDRYHRELVRRCGNHRLATIANTFMDQAYRVRILTLRLREKPVRSTQEHREQMRTILAGDTENIREIYRRHRKKAVEELLDILEKFKRHNL